MQMRNRKEIIMKSAKWIWLPRHDAPELQHTKHTVFDKRVVPFAIVQFQKAFPFSVPMQSVSLHVSGDCRYRLTSNGTYLGMGPAFPGGDWARTDAMPQRYYDSYSFAPDACILLLCAEVQLSPTLLCDISDGKGGFFLEGDVLLADGTHHPLATDDSWSCRIVSQWESDFHFYAERAEKEWHFAEIIERPLPIPSDIPVCDHRIVPMDLHGEADKIYTGTLCCDIETSSPCVLKLIPFETPDLEDTAEEISASSSIRYEGFRIRSVGGIRVEVLRGNPIVRNLAVRSTFYPGPLIGCCSTNDSRMNLVMETCEHTLKICRQSIHLDSPRHMEPLGCTGDYYLESLMEYYCFDDHHLTRFDLVRTARLLEATDGMMFHTGYSLMWIAMLKDYILYTGDDTVLADAEKAIRILLERFHTYEGSDGLLENPPNYMFADWVEINGYSMHHPPKALGQAILNALYYQALQKASDLLKEPLYQQRAEKLKAAFTQAFWDENRKLFTSGKTGPTETNEWLPQNASESVFPLHANAMAVACQICSGARARQVIHTIMNDSTLPDYQPYFAHFIFQALWNTDLLDFYAMPLFRRWIPMVEACRKGLAEGWISPCDGYIFDHSHAWGGCPRYWLPRSLIGLEILEPGFKTIRLSPKLKTIAEATVRIPTPYGLFACEIHNGKIKITASPKEITILSGEAV